jgi:glutathione synthase/RimK-type ligase-like ATP-grasp enzyme
LILIIGNPETYESKLILKEIRNKKHKFQFLSWEKISSPLDLKKIDLILIRSPPSINWHEMAIFLLTFIEGVERQGIMILPSSKNLRLCDKFSIQMVVSKGKYKIKTPETILTSDYEKASKFVIKHKTVVNKPLIGGGGRDINKIDTKSMIFIKKILQKDGYILLQKFIENQGYDIRTVLVNGRTVSQYIRTNPNDFRYNLKLGGKPVQVSEFILNNPNSEKNINESKLLSEQIIKDINMKIVATDILPGADNNLYFLEINPFFGFKGSKDNIAGEILNFLELEKNNLESMKCLEDG